MRCHLDLFTVIHVEFYTVLTLEVLVTDMTSFMFTDNRPEMIREHIRMDSGCILC